jgi:PPM family protein phosphatase
LQSRCKLDGWENSLATAVVRYTAAAMTDRGRKRSSNQDAFGYSIEDGVYLVCDGMGGAAAGEVASSLAIEEVLRHMTSRPDRSERGNASHAAEEAVVAANGAIHERGQRNTRLAGMGTTLVGLLTDERQAWIFHVGDSRCYRLRTGHLHQCTEDHSLVEEQIRLGHMTRAEAARSPLRNVITRALGTQASVTPDVAEADVEAGDLFLLCSDGLTRELSDEKIQTILNTSAADSLEEACTRLIQAANKAGGHDNITCLLVRVD